MDLRKMMQVYRDDGLAVDLDFIHYSLADESIKSFAEKLRSLLIFGSNSRRYKDIFDMYYLKDIEVIADGIVDWIKNLQLNN